MAIKYLDNISLEGNQLQNSLLQVLATNPAPLGAGQIFYNSTTGSVNYYNGNAWIALDDVGDISAVIAGTALNGGGDFRFSYVKPQQLRYIRYVCVSYVCYDKRTGSHNCYISRCSSRFDELVQCSG